MLKKLITTDSNDGLTVVTHRECMHWDDYVLDHPKGTIFHSQAMIDVHAHTKGHSPIALAAQNRDGEIVALLVSVVIETLAGLASRFASRVVMFAEPICDKNEEGIAGLRLLIKRHDEMTKNSAMFSEVRPVFAKGAEHDVLREAGYEFLDYLNFVIDLDRTEEELWGSVSKNQRRAIRKAERQGVELVQGEPTDSVETLYRLLQTSYRHGRVPLPDASLFKESMSRLAGDQFRLAFANYKGETVAVSLELIHKDLVYGWYGGTKRVAGVSAYALLQWDVIRWSRSNGYSLYDMGGAGWPGEEYGPKDHKAKFGGDLVTNGRYRKTFMPLRLWMAELAYSKVRGILSPKPTGSRT
jgi:CelD/BcsL family acetyltransferase involved in cellulose biosynthesis